MKLSYEGTPHGDSDIIADLIEETVPEELDIAFMFYKDGLVAELSLRPPHHASWNVIWRFDSANKINTGDDDDPSPYLANPDCQSILIEQFKKLYRKLLVLCDCKVCQPREPGM